MIMCFTCKTRPAGNKIAGSYSAYCAQCQPTSRGLRRGSEVCQCAACGRVFSGIEAFDRHQSMKRYQRGGPLCTDPSTMLRKDGQPVYGVVRGEWGVLRYGRTPGRWET